MGLDRRDHQALARWAADCAERVLPLFEEQRPSDDRPRRAVAAGRAWAREQITTSEARAAAVAAHTAAREADDDMARAAARAAGHAAATAHVPAHASHAANYAVTAVARAAISHDTPARERDWQRGRLPARLRALASSEPHREDSPWWTVRAAGLRGSS